VSEAGAVFVEAPARLHMGLLDMRGELGRRFGGLGAALAVPSLLLEARRARELSAAGDESERVLQSARRFLAHHRIEAGAAFCVHRAIPAHAGLGSGTQLALATARALAMLYDRPLDAAALAEATGRGRRSAIGTWAFEQGGFLLEGGRRVDGDAPAPLLLRRPMPADWRCVIAIPQVPQGLSGSTEEQAFRDLPPPSEALVARIAHVVLMGVLPALVEADLPAFGRGITEVQRLVGEMFAPVQGDRFAHGPLAELVEALLAEGALGAGQSSWGPAVYGFALGDGDAQGLADRLRARMKSSGPVFVTAFDNRGARCWTQPGATRTPSDPSRG
jgi:beta-ribofuranosylaminobenzene 5'-phosphate synthase